MSFAKHDIERWVQQIKFKVTKQTCTDFKITYLNGAGKSPYSKLGFGRKER